MFRPIRLLVAPADAPAGLFLSRLLNIFFFFLYPARNDDRRAAISSCGVPRDIRRPVNTRIATAAFLTPLTPSACFTKPLSEQAEVCFHFVKLDIIRGNVILIGRDIITREPIVM